MPRPPASEPADADQDQQREREQHDRDRGGADRVVALDLLEDEHRGDLRLERDVARDQDDRAELADRAGERQRGAAQDRRHEVGEDHAHEDGPAVGAERQRRLLHLAVELDQDRLDGADDERQRDEQQREQHGELRERDVDPDRAGRAVERQQREAGDDRRQRERQVDQRVDDALAAEPIADEDPRDQREAQRGDRLAAADRAPERVEAALGRAGDHGGERQQDYQAQPERRDAEPEGARPDGRAPSQVQGERRHFAVDTPASSSIFAIAPPSMSNRSALTLSQPPRSSIVNSPGGSGNFSLLAARTSSLTGR